MSLPSKRMMASEGGAVPSPGEITGGTGSHTDVSEECHSCANNPIEQKNARKVRKYFFITDIFIIGL
jgi:hypothetical protein